MQKVSVLVGVNVHLDQPFVSFSGLREMDEVSRAHHLQQRNRSSSLMRRQPPAKKQKIGLCAAEDFVIVSG